MQIQSLLRLLDLSQNITCDNKEINVPEITLNSGLVVLISLVGLSSFCDSFSKLVFRKIIIVLPGDFTTDGLDVNVEYCTIY